MSETRIIFDVTGPAMIFATIVGPVLAVWASEWRYSRRSKQESRGRVFHTLMSTRATRLNIVHVEALNQIDFVFQDKKYSLIRESWKLYRQQLQSVESAEVQAVWQTKANDLFANLLHEISKGLNLPYTKSYIIDKSYRPDAHLTNELDFIEIRQLILQVLKDGRPINIRSVDEPKT
jgi:hypothetical protein